ncbi:MAG TPA: hypothetical protein VKA32_01070 [Gammaproteobacteria bacterium]|nr:hypothetical protein [Gammaproteobacteria bacterium]
MTRPTTASSTNDLGPGDYVEIRGYWNGTRLVATRLKRKSPEDGCALRGTAAVTSGQLSIFTVKIQLQDPQQLNGINNGDSVEADTNAG